MSSPSNKIRPSATDEGSRWDDDDEVESEEAAAPQEELEEEEAEDEYDEESESEDEDEDTDQGQEYQATSIDEYLTSVIDADEPQAGRAGPFTECALAYRRQD